MTKSIDMPDMAQISTILGVDFGEAKIGLAIADEETKMAFAFDTLKNDKEFLKNLREIVACEHVKTIVIGMTKHAKDDASALEKMKFAKMVENGIGVEVVFQEEMFSTKMAQANIKMRGKKNIAALDDQEAARIILQEWLDAKSIA